MVVQPAVMGFHPSYSNVQLIQSRRPLRISWPKTKIQNVGSGPQPPSILVDGNPVDSVYLPSTTSSDIVASPSLATSPDCRTAPQHIKPYSLTPTSHSVVFPILPGIVGLAAHVADGSTESETTPARHLPTSGDRPLDAVIIDERRDGPRWLCDDGDDLHWSRLVCFLCYEWVSSCITAHQHKIGYLVPL